MCHIGQTTSQLSCSDLTPTILTFFAVLLGSLQHGSCVIQPTKIAFSTDELFDMVHRCGLNRLNQFATFLVSHLRNSRLNPKVLSLLVSLDEVLYSGLPLAREEEEWALHNGINLTVIANIFPHLISYSLFLVCRKHLELIRKH
jgi:hypothetical protein